jgi:hypothetical protein
MKNINRVCFDNSNWIAYHSLLKQYSDIILSISVIDRIWYRSTEKYVYLNKTIIHSLSMELTEQWIKYIGLN